MATKSITSRINLRRKHDDMLRIFYNVLKNCHTFYRFLLIVLITVLFKTSCLLFCSTLAMFEWKCIYFFVLSCSHWIHGQSFNQILKANSLAVYYVVHWTPLSIPIMSYLWSGKMSRIQVLIYNFARRVLYTVSKSIKRHTFHQGINRKAIETNEITCHFQHLLCYIESAYPVLLSK